MRNLSYAELIQLYNECHGPSGTPGTHVMKWAVKMERMLGPDDPRELKGFLIRGRIGNVKGLYLHGDCQTWSSSPCDGQRWTWGETAVRITNSRTLEAIRINNLDIAIDYKGRTIAILGRDKDG